MTSIDDRVRALIATAAENVTPGSVPPLRLPQAEAGDRQEVVAGRWPRWLAPAAAAASIAVIAAAALVISNAVASRPRPVSPAAVSVPPYYIGIAKPGNDAAIYATRSGAVIARVVPPGTARPVIGVTAAADDRTFAIAVPEGRHWNVGQPPKRFYLVKFNPVTRSVTMTPIPELQVPRNALLRGMALAPSGTKLAVNYTPSVSTKPQPTDELKVVDLVTGAIRTWTSSRGLILTSGNPLDLSWANDNTTLAFSWYGFTVTPSERTLPTSGFWLLDTVKAGGDLIADSRRVLRYAIRGPDVAVKGGYFAAYPALAPDGRTVVAALTSRQSDTSGYFWFATYDAANGRLEHQFGRASLSKTPLRGTFGLFWTAASGRLLVVAAPPGHHGQLGIVRPSGHMIVLPHDQNLVLLPGPAW